MKLNKFFFNQKLSFEESDSKKRFILEVIEISFDKG